MVSWVEALKEYAKKTGKYVVPKKGSAEYEAVRKIMSDGGASAPASAPVEKKARKPRVKKAVEEVKEVKEKKPRKPRAKKVVEEVKEEVKEVKEKKPRKPRAKKAVEVKEANAMDAKPRRGRRKAEAGSVPAGLDLTGGATAKGIERQKNPEAILEQATNAHLPVVPTGSVPKLKIPKSATVDSKVRLSVGAESVSELVDKEPIHNAVPFDMKALRRTLGA